MKKIVAIGIGLYLLVINSAAAGNPYPEVTRISAELAYQKFKKGNVVLVDTMNPVRFRKGHILGSINIPYDGPHDLQTIREMNFPFPPEQEFIIYCG